MRVLALFFIAFVPAAAIRVSATGDTAASPVPVYIPLEVHDYEGDGPAGLASNAVPFAPGALFDAANVRLLQGTSEISLSAKVLAKWPQDNSIRALLLQFAAPAGTYTLEVGAVRATADRPFTAVTWDLPAKIFTLPANYLSKSLIFWEQKPLGQSGFPAWDDKQLNYYYRIENPGTAACVRDDQYYDAITTTYQLYARTGGLKYLINARRWALHHRRDQIYLDGPDIGHPRCPGAYISATRYTFPQGLIYDYFMFGDEEDKRVSGLVVDNFYMPHADVYYYKAPGTRGWWTEREPAFSLIGMLAHYQATGDAAYITKVKDRITSLHGMQVDNGRRAWVHNLYDHDPSEGCSESDWGSSPWMSGLLLEAVITYHKLTNDPVARDSILMALDDLRARYLAKNEYAGVSFVYLGCPLYTDGTPDLDNLIAHAFGYGYTLTGDQGYLKTGTDIFNTSVRYGVTYSHKHYDQQFRSSGHFVAYVGGPAIRSVVNAATYSGDLTCSAGGLASILGAGLTSGETGSAAALPLPLDIGGVRVRAGDIYLPLLFVSPQQINFQCPDLADGGHAQFTVEAGGLSSPPVDVTAGINPGIFSLNAYGSGQGAVIIANSDMIAMPVTSGIPSRPVRRGEYISIYATGLGGVRNSPPPGAPAPAGTGCTLEAAARVSIGGIDAQVTYAGLAPGLVGLYQVNAQVPASAPLGDAVPVSIVVVDMSGIPHASNTVTIAVGE